MGWGRRKSKASKAKLSLDPRLPKSPAALFFQEIWSVKALGTKNLFSKTFALEDIGELSLGWPAEVYSAYDDKALYFGFKFEVPFGSSQDRIDLFFDTKPGLSKGITRFCHQFALVSEEDTEFLEVTSFRAKEDSHEKADSKMLGWTRDKNTWSLKIPFSALHGYEKSRLSQLGFALAITVQKKEYPLIGASTETAYSQYPGLWMGLEFLTS